MSPSGDTTAVPAAAADSDSCRQTPIRIATYNIISGRNSRLEMALRAMQQMNVDLGVLTEVKLTDGIHTRYSAGYHVVATAARSHNQGGVALFFRDSPFWQVEEVRRFGPNVISFHLVTGRRRIPVVGAYVPPADLDTMGFIHQAMEAMPQGCEPLLLGDLNADLAHPRDARAQTVATDMVSYGLQDMLLHFRQRRGFRQGWSWRQRRNGEVVSSRCDYILGTDRRMFTHVGFHNPRLFTSDHLLVLGVLSSAPLRRNMAYRSGRKRFPLQVPKWGPPTKADALFGLLCESVAPPSRAERRAWKDWVSDSTWKLVDELTALQKVSNHDAAEARRLKRRIRQSFKADRKERVKVAGEAIESKLANLDARGAWGKAKAWYRQAADRPRPPSVESLDAVTTEYSNLYTKEHEPPGEMFPVHVAAFDVSDEVPSEEEIAEAVRRLRSGKAPGPSGLRADHLKEWLALAEREENPVRVQWDHLVSLVRHVYETGELPTRLAWASMVLLPKGDGNFRGIGLLEVVWKLLTSIMDARFKASITFHDVLHGFRPLRGCGTAIFEAKLFQQLAAIEQVPVFEVFLDLKKAYDTLDRERTLEILEQYGVGPKALRLLRRFWDKQEVVAKQGGYHGQPFKATRGVTQGDIVSPTIFNIVVDAIVRHWLSLVLPGSEGHVGLGSTVREQIALFYADDGLIGSRSSEWLQNAISVLSELFQRVGLRTNTTKTKAMVCSPGYISSRQASPTYRRRRTGEGPTPRERRRRRVTCSECGKGLAAGSLRHHLLTQHGLLHESEEGLADAPGRQPAAYTVSFPRTIRRASCPVEGCTGTATSRVNLRRHFVHRHPNDTLAILEEGPRPLPKCEQCGMHVTRIALASGHLRSAFCREGMNRRRQRQAVARDRLAREVVFSVAGADLDSVSVFRYLGRPLSSTDNDWPAIYRNLSRARQRWGMISRLLVREGASARIAGMFYKAVVQSALLYGCETWVVTDQVLKTLEGFHHRVARRLSGRMPRYFPREDRWVYPPIEEALNISGLYPIAHYIRVRQDTLIDNIATRPILNLCEESERHSGSVSRLYWWTQKPLDKF